MNLSDKQILSNEFNYKFFKFVGWKERTINQRFALFAFIFSSPIFFYVAVDIYSAVAIDQNPGLIFFGLLDQFTSLSNYFGYFVLALMVFNPHHKWFKGNRLVLANASYLLFTFIGFNTLLSSGYSNLVNNVNQARINGTDLFVPVVFVFQTVWNHAFNPLIAIALFVLTIIYDQKLIVKSYTKETALTMIFPFVYALYIVIVPFTNVRSIETNQIVIGGTLIDGVTIPYSVYGSITDTAKNPITWLLAFLLMFVFTAWTIGFHFLEHFVYKKTKKLDLVIENRSKKFNIKKFKFEAIEEKSI